MATASYRVASTRVMRGTSSGAADQTLSPGGRFPGPAGDYSDPVMGQETPPGGGRGVQEAASDRKANRGRGMANGEPEPTVPDERVNDVLAMIMFRNAYQRDRHLFLIRLIIVFAVLSGISTFSAVMLALNPPEAKYFLVDNEGRIRSIVPLDRPIESVDVVGNWAANAVRAALTFNYVNYREVFAEVRSYFVPAGFQSFEQALVDSRILPSVIQNSFILTATLTGAPVLEVQGIMDLGNVSRYAWRFQVPVLLTYQSPSGQQTQSLVVSVTVVRVPVEQNPSGLGIVQIVARSGSVR